MGNAVRLRTLSADGREESFLLDLQAPMKDLINDFCTRNGVKRGRTHFRVDGALIQDDHTPLQLELEDGDVRSSAPLRSCSMRRIALLSVHDSLRHSPMHPAFCA